MPHTEKASIKFDGTTIEYTVVRSARRKKTVEITLDPQQGVVVRSPARTPRKEIAALVQKRAKWILRKATDNILNPTPRSFTDGETLFYLGRKSPSLPVRPPTGPSPSIYRMTHSTSSRRRTSPRRSA